MTENRSYSKGVEAFPHFYVGINSLAELATKEDRVCVLNILGSESRGVTPTSHVYSGGNIVCGTMPGRSGSVLKTKIGDIPVYNSVAEALEAGHQFNIAVVYVPPSGVKDSVIEAVRVNPAINKIIILTEKVALSDARIIRQYCQRHNVDVFGANCLGIADAHQHVRIGGALGGSSPEESLVPGSIAVYSNSGNFTTTMATYILTAGWGTTVSYSSGKDVYIYYAAAEFTHAFHNDDRTKAALMYIEPGGYYEHDLEFKKPVVACVVGRWKDKLTRACGHAGAMAGSGDNAGEKERWFMNKLGVNDIYSPENPVHSAKGAVVTNIAHLPEALTAVMKANGVEPDFEPKGNLSLKPWLGNNQDIELPSDLDLKLVDAISPYKEQLDLLTNQLGIILPRQTMKDASGASLMDPKTQVSKLYGVSVLDAALHSYEDNLVMSLVQKYPDENGRALANVALNAFVNQHNTPALMAAEASREAGNSPNTVLSSSMAILGPKTVDTARKAVRILLNLFKGSELVNPSETSFDFSKQLSAVLADDEAKAVLVSSEGDQCGQMIFDAARNGGAKSVFLDFIEELAKQSGAKLEGQIVLAAITCHLGWRELVHKRLSMTTMINMPWHFRVFSSIIGTSVAVNRQDKESFCGVSNLELMSSWSFTETAYLALLGKRPDKEALFAFSVLLGLIVTNGPGTISAQGAKGAVSADGPEVPERVQLNKAYVGFLTHTGYAHGGNGFEAIEFLITCFKESNLTEPGSDKHGLDLPAMAMDTAKEYKAYKTKAKAEGNLSYAKIPCVNHPVFKDKDVNYDPREVFVNDLFKQRGSVNVFLDYYHELVQALFKTGVSNKVYCVNVDAVIAVILLKMLWKPYADGEISKQALETAAFTTFLYGRTIGETAEIEDHLNRGRNMDTRTAASKCSSVN
ncbi:MAG: CoA-binding protein [Pseudomonadota bacterium]